MLSDLQRGLRFLFINQRFPPSFLKILRALQHKRISTLFQQRFLKYLHVTSQKKKVATIYGLLSPYMVYLPCLQRFSLRCEISVLKVAQPLCLFTISPTKKNFCHLFLLFQKIQSTFNIVSSPFLQQRNSSVLLLLDSKASQSASRPFNLLTSGADPGAGQHCVGHGQIFGKLVLLLVFGCGPTSGDTVRFVGWICPCTFQQKT